MDTTGSSRPRPPNQGAALLAGRLAACAVLLMLLGDPAAAQDVRWGLRAGPTFGFLNDSATPFFRDGEAAGTNTNVRIDAHGGAYVIIPLAAQFGLQTELLYIRKGGHFSHSGDDSYQVERYQLSYVQGHILGRRDISLPGPLRLHALVGVTLERLLGGKMRRAIHVPDAVLREEADLQAQGLVHQWDVGGLVGIGIGYPIGAAGRLALELRYARGFRSVFTQATRPPDQRLGTFDDPPPLTRLPPRLRHDVITASLTYTLPLRP